MAALKEAAASEGESKVLYPAGKDPDELNEKVNESHPIYSL